MTELSNTENQLITGQPGEILKALREKKGLSKKEIALALNLPERFIEYLEIGDFDKLPGHTFARGYIKNYAKFLEMENAEELVHNFDTCTGTNALGSSVNNLQQIKQIKHFSNNIYWLVSFIIVLVVIGIIFIWWQSRNTTNAVVSTVDNTIVVEPTASKPNNSSQLTIPLSEVAAPATTSDPSTSNNTAVDTDTLVADQSVSESQVTADTQNATTTNPLTSSQSEGALQAKFTANCWITVNDATGKTLVSKLMTKGSNLEIKGKPPLEVILGAPNAVTMTYNGQAVTINAKAGATHRLKLGQ